eukprot:s636_g21.t2
MLCASACRSADKHTPTILAAYAGERSRCARPVDNIGGESIRCLSVVQAWPGIVLKLKFVNEASDAVSHAKRAFAILLSHSTCYFVAPPASMSDPAALQVATQEASDGTVFRLRSFPIVYRWQLPAQRESGQVDGVHYAQSMGRMILTYPLRDSNMDLDEDDIKVEMSCWQLLVSRKDGKGKLTDLCKEVYDDILRDLSWWKVDTAQSNPQDKALIIYLAKARHRSWASPWYPGALNPHKKSIFGWTERQAPKGVLKGLKIDVEAFKNIEPGEPEDWNHEISTAMTPEQICTGITVSESESLVQVVIHLDEEALESATARVPLEEVFAADISAEMLSVYLRGDSFSICAGRFSGKVVPEKSNWQISSVRRKNLPEGCTVKSPAFYNPALRIMLSKAKESFGNWDEVFQDFQCCSFGLPRDRIEWDERVRRCSVLSPGCPNNRVGKAQRARDLLKKVETSQDLLLNRVILLFHLEDKLLQLCDTHKLHLHDLFSMRTELWPPWPAQHPVRSQRPTFCIMVLAGLLATSTGYFSLQDTSSLGRRWSVGQDPLPSSANQSDDFEELRQEPREELQPQANKADAEVLANFNSVKKSDNGQIQICNPCWFGAVGDGKTDNTEAFRTAMELCSSTA